MNQQASRADLSIDSGVAVIVVAGGTGERFGVSGGKQLAQVLGMPVLSHALQALDDSQLVTEFVVVVHPDRVDEYHRSAVMPMALKRPVQVVPGGDSRADSVRRGIAAASPDTGILAIHDGARPLVTAESLDRAILALLDLRIDGAVVGHPAYDTLKKVEDARVTATPDRSSFWIAQTPQVFRGGVLREAYADAEREGFFGTDDASYVERIGGEVRMIEGPRENIKVTVAEDLAVVEAIIAYRKERDR